MHYNYKPYLKPVRRPIPIFILSAGQSRYEHLSASNFKSARLHELIADAPAQNPRSMRILLNFTLKAAISCLLLYFVFTRVNFKLVGQRLDRIEFVWLAAAILTVAAQTALGAFRWQTIVKHCIDARTPSFRTSNAVRYTFIGTFFNQVLPSTVGGDAVRAWLLARDQNDWRAATYSALIDRLAGVLVLALLVIVCLPWSFSLITDVNGRIALLAVGFGSVGACLAFLALGVVKWRWLDRQWLTREIAGAAAAASRLFRSPSDAILIAAYSLAIQILSATAAWCLAKSVTASLEWNQALLLILPVLLIATIPLSIAGWGTREAAMILAFGYAGLHESDGLIVSVLLGIAMFAAGLIGGVIWILDRGRRYRDTRQPAL